MRLGSPVVPKDAAEVRPISNVPHASGGGQYLCNGRTGRQENESRCEVVELVSRALQLQAFSRFSWSEVRGASTNRLLSEKGEVK